MNRRIAVCLFASALMASTAIGGEKGVFQFGAVRLEPVDSVAWKVDAKEEQKAFTAIAIADFAIDRAELSAAIDSVNALYMQVNRQEHGNFVIVKLFPPKHCGIFAYLTSEERPQQIELRNDFAATIETARDSRVAGVCQGKGEMFDDAYEFRLPFDLVPTPIAAPGALPAGGGEPGRALVALAKAIETQNFTEARRHLPTEQMPQDGSPPVDMKFYFEGLALNYPKVIVPTGGLLKKDRAQVEIKGTSYDGTKLNGVYLMQKFGDDWRIVAQSLYTE